MNEEPLNRAAALAALPPARPAGHAGIPDADRDAARGHLSDRKLIVLDDDPTGTQTVHGIPVVTRWSVDHLARELLDPSPASYVLTNSRSLDEDRAVALTREIAGNLAAAAARTGRRFGIISRSDSTLRGHFPAELDAIEAGLGAAYDAWVLCPFFAEGGRLTIGDVHYVAEGDLLVPAALTPFAADAAFGFRSSNLREWVAEKSGGRIGGQQIASLSVAELRTQGPGQLAEKLSRLAPRSVCIVNVADTADLSAAASALAAAEAGGRRFLYRTAASFVAALAGIRPRPLLAPQELDTAAGCGTLVVVGSYVPKTTEQLERLLAQIRPAAFELDVRRLLDDRERDRHVAETAERVAAELAGDRIVAVYTSRQLLRADGQQSLSQGRRISQALVEVVRRLSRRPRVLLAKGGITSSDLATEGCGVERAMVLGQLLPGVPVWRCGPESRFPGLPLVVFPGNVGGPDALAEAVQRLSAGVRQSQPEPIPVGVESQR